MVAFFVWSLKNKTATTLSPVSYTHLDVYKRQVKRELKFFIDQKVPQIKFVDRTFNCNHAHAMELWRFIKAVSYTHLDGKEISPEDLAGKSGKVKIRFDYKNTTSYTVSYTHLDVYKRQGLSIICHGLRRMR